jgi:hypothetical protein
MRRPYPMRYFVFQNGPQDLRPDLPGRLFHLRLHLCAHLGYRRRHPYHQLLPLHDLEPSAIVSNGDATLDWRHQSPPNIGEARTAIENMVSQGYRASEVITRIRALIKKCQVTRARSMRIN